MCEKFKMAADPGQPTSLEKSMETATGKDNQKLLILMR